MQKKQTISKINKAKSWFFEKINKIYYQQLYANKMENLEEMDKFLEKYNFPKMN